MINPSLEVAYHELCELHREVNRLAAEYYQKLYAERSIIKQLKATYRPNENYTKWCRKARVIARKTMDRKPGQRMVVDHIKPLLLCFLEGMTPEQASDRSNLQLLSKKDNRKKSYLI
jgi:hypothetical protein